MKHTNFSTFVLVIAISMLSGFSQSTKNLAEKLGYAKDAKLLIIHADDLGLSHSTNIATFKAFENKGITSGSIMVPCPWFTEVAEYAKANPGLDLGIHLTLTSEWKNYKWGGVASSNEIPGLLSKNGYMYPSNEEMGKTAKPEEVGKELRAQIEKAIALGINPTHFDNHMGSLLVNPELIIEYVKLAKEYKVPFLFPAAYSSMLPPDLSKLMGPDVVMVDNLFMLNPAIVSKNWGEPYKKAIEAMKPGLNEIIVHLSADNDEMQAIAAGVIDFGSKWRQNDFDYVTSNEFKQTLKENNIILITWKQIKEL